MGGKFDYNEFEKSVRLRFIRIVVGILFSKLIKMF